MGSKKILNQYHGTYFQATDSFYNEKYYLFFWLFQRHANNLLQLDNGVKVPPRLVVIYGLDNLLADRLANRTAAFF